MFHEIDYFVMLVMTAFLGWRIAEKLLMSKASKLSCKDKILEDDKVVVPQLKYRVDSTHVNQKVNLRIPPTQTPAVRAPVLKSAEPKRAVSPTSAPPVLQPPPGLPLPKTHDSKAMQEAPWRKVAAFATPVASREDDVPRQLGRVVCWKETSSYGFIVDEAGARLFVRQAEVEGGEPLRAGQLIWFRRGKANAGQAAKALNVTVVSQEAAKVMRQSAPMLSSSSPTAANKALAFPLAVKKEVVAVPPPTVIEDTEKSSESGTDDDVSPSLGAASKEEQIKKLKDALQWAANEF
jgi:cold shock CspA family protein